MKSEILDFRVTNLSKIQIDFRVYNNKLKIKTLIQGMETFSFIVRILVLVFLLSLLLLMIVESLISPISFELNQNIVIPLFIILFILFVMIYRPIKQSIYNVIETKMEINHIYNLLRRGKTYYN